MSIYTDAEQFGLLALTPAEIAAALAPLTVHNIPAGDVREIMRRDGLWLKNPISRARDRGKIGVAMTDPAFPSALFDALVELESGLYDERIQSMSTGTDLTIAAQVAATLAGLVATGVLTQAESDAFVALGGGLRHPGIDAAAVTAAIDQHAIDEAERLRVEALQSAVGTALNETIHPAISTNDMPTIIAALRSAADTLEA